MSCSQSQEHAPGLEPWTVDARTGSIPAPPAILQAIQPIIDQRPNLLSAALRHGLLDPSQLDPENPDHVQAITHAVGICPDLPIPQPFLTRLHGRVLWKHPHNLILAHELAERLRAHDRDTIDALFTTLFHTPKPFPEPIQAALVELTQDGILDASQLSALHKMRQLAPQTKTALLRAIRSQASRKAALTRAQPGAKAPARAKTDPLLQAIRDDDTKHLRQFGLNKLPAERVQALLPDWLKASRETRSYLVAVPHLPPEAMVAALEAWTATGCWRDSLQPIARLVADRLSSHAVYAVIAHWIRGYATIEPTPDDAWLTNTLFRLSLDCPDEARRLTVGLELTRRRDALTAMVTATPDLEIPTDPTAQWIQLLSTASDVEAAFKIAPTLMEQFDGWTPEYQQALAPSLLTFTHQALLHL